MSDQINLSPIIHDDLTPIEIPVTYMGQSYILREADEGSHVTISNARIAAARFADGELDRVEKAAEVEPLAVSLCLTKINVDKSETSVSIDEIKGDVKKGRRGWPARLVKQLYDRVIEISGLDDKLTVDSIDKQIVRLQKRRAKLAKGDTGPKDQPSDTVVTSG